MKIFSDPLFYTARALLTSRAWQELVESTFGDVDKMLSMASQVQRGFRGIEYDLNRAVSCLFWSSWIVFALGFLAASLLFAIYPLLS